MPQKSIIKQTRLCIFRTLWRYKNCIIIIINTQNKHY